MATVIVPTIFRQLTGGEKVINLTDTYETFGEVVDALESNHPGIKKSLVDDEGELKKSINIYLGNEDIGRDDIRYLGGLAAAVALDSFISIVPAVAGGQA